MTKHRVTLSGPALASLLVFGAMSAPAMAGDLSKYRNFQFGTDLATVAAQVGASPSQAKTVHSRPALFQDLEWRPQPLGTVSQTESAEDVVFTFYNNELYRIVVNYDRYQIEGLTAKDIIEAVSEVYGIAGEPAPPVKAAQEPYGDEAEVLARWQDTQYRFDLVRLSYRPSFRLTGVMKRLEAPAQAAMLEAARLDDKEAPQREVERIAKEGEVERAKLEKARLVNKPKFRP